MKSFLARNGRNGKVAQVPEPPILNFEDDADDPDAPAQSVSKLVRTDAFDQPVVLQQSSIWSRGIVWGIVGVATFAILWATFARIEQAVPATGKLEPEAKVQNIQAPVGGVVSEILVKDGQRVKKGDVLIRFDPRATQGERQSLKQVRDSLVSENRFYQAQLMGMSGAQAEAALQVTLRPEILALTTNRAALIAENQLYRAQLTGGEAADNLSPEQRARLRVGLVESNSRASAARLEVDQLQAQFSANEVQLNAAKQSLSIDQEILGDVRPLAEEGGIARLQLRRQEQEVLNGQAEVDRLTQERQRLEFAIAQAQQKFQNTLAVTGSDLLNRMSDNEKRIADIDSQINKQIVENAKRIAELDSQLNQAELTLQYQELRAPIDGIVFDLQANGPGFVANTSEPILKIVPGEGLTAEVFITNQDIGFVSEGMPVDVRVDSFPFSEFGDVKGKVVSIGSDALPPDQIYPFYRFPAKIQLDQQMISIRGREIPLQSGMSITANIITRDRSVLSIFTDMFNDKVDTLRTVR
ncbi:MAG TPA: HlyD family efflux transporter periplasmic adaptor subunit [Chroococcidiopsis sp.]